MTSVVIVYDKFDTAVVRAFDLIVFAGDFITDIKDIKKFQQFISPLNVVVFHECCFFATDARHVFAEYRYKNLIYDAATKKISYCGQILEAATYILPLEDENYYKIYIENDNIHTLPRLIGNIENLEVTYRNCSEDTFKYIRNIYGRIDSCVKADQPSPNVKFMKLIDIEWSNIFCFRSGRIDFESFEVAIINGVNGAGKSSLISIILCGFFGIKTKKLLRKGTKSGHIKCRFETDKKYDIHLTVPQMEVTIRCGAEIVATSYDMMAGYDTSCIFSEKSNLKVKNFEKTRDIFSELCGLRLTEKCISGDSDTTIESLSTGQKFMFELACKLSEESASDVFLIDERMDRLDISYVPNCLYIIQKYREKVLIISHRSELSSYGTVYKIDKHRGASVINVE
jgi:ABC-type Mn2+/Zn2+ transport system ATPase subunit